MAQCERPYSNGLTATYAFAQRVGYEIIHPLTDEAGGVRLLFVRNPHGNVINIVWQPS